MKKWLSILLCLMLLSGIVTASAQSKALLPFVTKVNEAMESHACSGNDANVFSYTFNGTSSEFSVQNADDCLKISGNIPDLGDVSLYFGSEAVYVSFAGMCYALEYNVLNDFLTGLTQGEAQTENADSLNEIVPFIGFGFSALPAMSELFGEVLTALMSSDCYSFETTETGMLIRVDFRMACDSVIATVDQFLESNETLNALFSEKQESLPITKEALIEGWNEAVKSFREQLGEGTYTAEATLDYVDPSYILTGTIVLGDAFVKVEGAYDMSEEGSFTGSITSNDFTLNATVKSVELGYKLTGSVTKSGETHDFEAVTAVEDTENKTSVTLNIDGGDTLALLVLVDLDDKDELENLLVTSKGLADVSFSAAMDVNGADIITVNNYSVSLTLTDENTMEGIITCKDFPGQEPKIVCSLGTENEHPAFYGVIYDYTGAEVLRASLTCKEVGPVVLPENAIFISAEMLNMFLNLATSSLGD